MRQALVLIVFLIHLNCYSQKPSNHSFAVLFYNTENLFDCRDDSLKRDEEFLPDGDKRWTPNRMYKKLSGLSKTIIASNQWNPPALVGLCEVENEWILKQLVYCTALANLRYGYIHYESEDIRGIDVALLYRKDVFNVIGSSPVLLSDSFNNFYTRDALHVKGVINTDTLHIIVNHWPSKRGGASNSEYKRELVSKNITSIIDSIKNSDQSCKLIVMGDFNADFEATSLNSLMSECNLNSKLTNKHLRSKKVAGSYKYQGQWDLIDHILIANDWLNSTEYYFEHKIIEFPFLLETDKTSSGLKPKRTYAGPRYIGGISDHLPVIVTIEKKK